VSTPGTLRQLLLERRVIVCCGAGGVGKTTTAAALGVAGARLGRRVLVLTIDPARRLAQALGIRENGPAPAPLAADLLAAVGVTPPGELHAWMLNPRVVFENLVARLSPNPEVARRVVSTALFGHLTRLVAGMQEYTAAEALFELSQSGKYDLIILDTPPSRNALDFLEAPGRLSRFLDERILMLFLPERPRFILLRKAAQRVSDVLGRVFGDAFFREMQDFLQVAKGLFAPMRQHADDVRRLLASQEATFLLITTSEAAALNEARFFRAKLQTLKLPFSGFVLNRSWAVSAQAAATWEVPLDAPAALKSALEKLDNLATTERAWAQRDRAFLQELQAELAPGALAAAAPYLVESLDEVKGLGQLAVALVGGA